MDLKKGLVIKAISSFFYVLYDDKIYECKSSKKLKLKKNKIIPGDVVEFNLDDLYIINIIERKNELIRPQIANIDSSILVFSLTEPNMNFNLLDKLITIMEYYNIEVNILLTKIDLLTSDEKIKVQEQLKYYQNLNYNILYNNQISSKKELFNIVGLNKKILLTGQSGVGKSTFVNKILNLNIKTQEISHALGRGKHTTRESTFYQVEKDTYIIDSPGFSSLEILFHKDNIKYCFKEFNQYSDKCKFRTCNHINEPQCEIKKQIELGNISIRRYENYLKFMED